LLVIYVEFRQFDPPGWRRRGGAIADRGRVTETPMPQILVRLQPDL
jgi:hypothetical protein